MVVYLDLHICISFLINFQHAFLPAAIWQDRGLTRTINHKATASLSPLIKPNETTNEHNNKHTTYQRINSKVNIMSRSNSNAARASTAPHATAAEPPSPAPARVDLNAPMPPLPAAGPLPHASTGAGAFQAPEIRAAEAAAAAAASPPVPQRRQRMAYKDRGIRAAKDFFLRPEKIGVYENIPDTTYLEGKITAVPRRTQVDYVLCWTDVSPLPAGFNSEDLRMTVFKGDAKHKTLLEEARRAYDAAHPNQQAASGRSQLSHPASSPSDPHRDIQRGLTGIRMSPILDPSDRRSPPTDPSVLYREDSGSEDGSEIGEGDTYFPIGDSVEENVVDDGYNVEEMEMDGEYLDYLSQMTFNYEELDEELVPPSDMYNGDGPCLRRGVAKRFSTVLGCVMVCGGLSYSFFKRLTANSNEYARRNGTDMDGRLFFAGLAYKNITVEEMIRFHGMVLKMSIDDRKLGGYEAYFTEGMSINLGRNYSVMLSDYPAWAAKVMSLSRFKQIRAAYHPEVGSSTIGDKCHQLRYAIDTCNGTSKTTFVVGGDLTFDEGGVASRSRMNPVRQYNKDKPNKFRVDFFVLANNSPGIYFIVHLDVYQGKNAENINIPEPIQTLPTTQKAVVNSVIQSGIGMDPDGKRRMFMDNRYTCAQLLVLLREQYGILGSGTTRANRIGWPKDQMNLSKSDERGTSKVLYDKRNEILVTQWVDNKVVSCTSTLQVSGKVGVTRRSGAHVLHLQVEKALKAYQDGMDAVDRGDQYREGGGGFASKAHYKKWYKKAYFAVLDFMLLNAFFAWNMAAEDSSLNRLKVKKFEFYAAVAEEMISYVDSTNSRRDPSTERSSQQNSHKQQPADKGTRNYCVVCRLEENWRREKGEKDDYGKNARCQDHMVKCLDTSCQLYAHNVAVDHSRRIFQLEPFIGKSCWDIAHSDECKGLWKISGRAGESVERSSGSGDVQEVKAQSYSVVRTHNIYKQLAEYYGKEKETRPRKRRRDDGDDEEAEVDEQE